MCCLGCDERYKWLFAVINYVYGIFIRQGGRKAEVDLSGSTLLPGWRGLIQLGAQP